MFLTVYDIFIPPPNVVGKGYIGFTVSVRLSASAVSVDGMICGHFLSCFGTDLPEIQNGYVFWVKEETHEGNLRNFEIYHFGRVFS